MKMKSWGYHTMEVDKNKPHNAPVAYDLRSFDIVMVFSNKLEAFASTLISFVTVKANFLACHVLYYLQMCQVCVTRL